MNFLLENGDSKELIKNIPNNSIDLIFTDPPYNVGTYSTGNIQVNGRKNINNNIADWDHIVFSPKEWLSEFKRILKPTGNIFVFTAENLIGEWHSTLDPEFDTFRSFVWHKTNPTPHFRKTSFLNSCEYIMCAWNKGHTWNFINQKEMHNFFQSPICMGNERIKTPHHPTQKPLKLLKHIITIASNPGDVVFDPFSGIASTAHAALDLDRNFIGFELDKSYYDGGLNRITGKGDQQKDYSFLLTL